MRRRAAAGTRSAAAVLYRGSLSDESASRFPLLSPAVARMRAHVRSMYVLTVTVAATVPSAARNREHGRQPLPIRWDSTLTQIDDRGYGEPCQGPSRVGWTRCGWCR